MYIRKNGRWSYVDNRPAVIKNQNIKKWYISMKLHDGGIMVSLLPASSFGQANFEGTAEQAQERATEYARSAQKIAPVTCEGFYPSAKVRAA